MEQDKISFKSVDEYIALQKPEIRETLVLLRKTIKDAVPEATEFISYKMPAYKFHGMLMFFAEFTQHYSVFVSPPYLNAFRNELDGFKTTKSAINIPNKMPVPVELLSRLAKYAAEKNIEKSKLKKKP
jgi:uncharacterized protein YdhG (YjbR/CyaY superfamily)